MKLTDLFTVDKNRTDGSSHTTKASAPNTALMSKQIRSLVPGQTIQGELVSRNGSEVQIKLSEELTIKARLEQNMKLEIGKSITFEVKNNGRSLVLNPLYTNVATDANVLKALDMASLPVNQDTIEMTQLLMKAGLSIDKNSLQQVFREYNQAAQAALTEIVELHKLGMTVNEANLSQLVSYKNQTHQLLYGLEQCADAISETIQNMLQTGEETGAEKVYQELLHLIQEGGTEEEFTNPSLIHTADGQLFLMEQQAGDGKELLFMEQQAEAGKELFLMEQQAGAGTVLHFPGDGQLLQALLQPENSQLLQQLLLGQGATDKEHASAQALQGENDTSMAQAFLPGKDDVQSQAYLQGGNDVLKQAFLQDRKSALPQALLRDILQNNAFLDSIRTITDEKGGCSELTTLREYLNKQFQKLWTLSPKEVAEPGKVEQFYDRLDRQLKGLTQMLESANQTHTEAYKLTANLTQNLDFLQQLNQAYAYVQLPLRLQQGNNAHGELYVYTNKKHMASKEGEISALLHLDMEHLGPVDIYVAMQHEKVNTQFYVQDEEMLKFLEAHMDILTKRLQARGYSLSCKLQARDEKEEQPGTMRQILQANGHVPVAQYAFDVRT